MLRVPVKTRRRDRRVRQPIKRDVVENVVTGQPLWLAVENTNDHLVAANVVIKYPASKADWRVGDSVERLRTKRHFVGVAQPVFVEIIQSIPRMLFLRRKARGWRTAGGKRFGNIRRDHCSHIGVNTEQSWWLLQSHYLRYCIAPVATLRHVFCVAETLHERRPRFRNGNGIPSGCRRLGRETVARQ